MLRANSKKLTAKSGFTLVELLVVISIIAVLSTIGLTIFSNVQKSARDSIRKSDLRTLATALELYSQQNGKYILPANSSDPDSCTRDTDKFYTEIAGLINDPSGAPKDPKGDKYCYISENNGQSFRLFAKLENCADPQIIPNIDCASANWNYSISSDDIQIAAAPGDTIVTATPSPSPSTNPSPSPSANPSPSPAAATYKRVFVTSTFYTGNLGGLSGADQKCSDRASAANLGGTWKAWISDSNKSPASQSDGDIWTQFNGEYRLVDGTKVADTWTDLTDESLDNAINITENNTPVSASATWTNTLATGSINFAGTILSCNDWKDGTNSSFGLGGVPQATTQSWTVGDDEYCNGLRRLYCFEQ